MKTYNPGIYEIENEDYHNSNGLSRSALLTFRKSPLHYWDEYKNENKKEEKRFECINHRKCSTHVYIAA